MMYGAAGVNIQQEAESKLKKARKLGYGQLPICMAKTQDSLSDNPKLRGRPQGFHAPRPRRRDRRGRGVPGGPHRRDHADAGPARASRGRADRRRRRGQHHRAGLTSPGAFACQFSSLCSGVLRRRFERAD